MSMSLRCGHFQVGEETAAVAKEVPRVAAEVFQQTMLVV